MEFLKAGEPVESNIFNQLDEKKRALIEKGVDVINLSIGTPDFQPDRHVMEAVSRAALDPDMYKYSLTETPELLEAVEKWYKRRYDVDLADDEIIQVSGSQEGFAHIGFAFAGPNDLILAPDPGYPIFTFGPLMTGATIALYPLREENNWQLDFNDIPEDIAERAKAIVVSYPNNPTTAVADRAFYEKLVLFAREHNMIVLHDNAYSDLMLDGTDGLSFLSIPGAKEVGVEFNSLSKTYNLTGMRVSFVVGNRELIARFRADRLRHVLSHSGRRCGGAERAAGHRHAQPQGLHGAPRRAVRRSAQHRLERPRRAGYDVRLGEGAGGLRLLGGVRARPARKDRRDRRSGQRVRQARRRLCSYGARRSAREDAGSRPQDC